MTKMQMNIHDTLDKTLRKIREMIETTKPKKDGYYRTADFSSLNMTAKNLQAMEIAEAAKYKARKEIQKVRERITGDVYVAAGGKSVLAKGIFKNVLAKKGLSKGRIDPFEGLEETGIPSVDGDEEFSG